MVRVMESCSVMSTCAFPLLFWNSSVSNTVVLICGYSGYCLSQIKIPSDLRLHQLAKSSLKPEYIPVTHWIQKCHRRLLVGFSIYFSSFWGKGASSGMSSSFCRLYCMVEGSCLCVLLSYLSSCCFETIPGEQIYFALALQQIICL